MDEIRNIITHWWNDTMRKDWRMALADPVERNRRLDELADEIIRHLTSSSSKAARICTYCDASVWDKEAGVCWFHHNNPPPA